MDKYIQQLVERMTTNRTIHGKPWEKVRRDRVDKLFPEFVDEFPIVEAIIQAALTRGVIKECFKKCDDGLVPAIRVSNFYYNWRGR